MYQRERNCVLSLADIPNIGGSSLALIGQWISFPGYQQIKCFLNPFQSGFIWAGLKMSLRFSCCVALLLTFCFTVTAHSKFPTLDHIRPKASDKAQGRAVVGLLKRLLGNRSTEFIVSVNRSLSNDSLDVCELRSTKNDKIVATGSSGVAVASGIYNYLKYFCNCHVSWSGKQLDVPSPLPKLTGVLRINTPHRWAASAFLEQLTCSPLMSFTGKRKINPILFDFTQKR